jgi:hypothetical protein
MKITKEQLKQLIKEELGALEEQPGDYFEIQMPGKGQIKVGPNWTVGKKHQGAHVGDVNLAAVLDAGFKALHPRTMAALPEEVTE